MAGAQYRNAVVTGASSGIGTALAKLLAEQGLEVALAARREPQLRALATEIEGAGGKARVYPVDVTDPAAVHQTLERADDELDGIDLVVANAGVGKAGWSGKLVWKNVEPTLAVNVVGATATLTTLIPRMVERGRGHLVGVSSLAQYRGLPGNAVYSASKAYLSNLLEGLRVDLQSAGITVTDIRPGFVKTAMTEGMGNLPFAVDAAQAAQEIYDAITAGKGVHTFPLPLAVGVKSLAALPNMIYDRLAQRMMP